MRIIDRSVCCPNPSKSFPRFPVTAKRESSKNGRHSLIEIHSCFCTCLCSSSGCWATFLIQDVYPSNGPPSLYQGQWLILHRFACHPVSAAERTAPTMRSDVPVWNVYFSLLSRADQMSCVPDWNIGTVAIPSPCGRSGIFLSWRSARRVRDGFGGGWLASFAD